MTVSLHLWTAFFFFLPRRYVIIPCVTTGFLLSFCLFKVIIHCSLSGILQNVVTVCPDQVFHKAAGHIYTLNCPTVKLQLVKRWDLWVVYVIYTAKKKRRVLWMFFCSTMIWSHAFVYALSTDVLDCMVHLIATVWKSCFYIMYTVNKQQQILLWSVSEISSWKLRVASSLKKIRTRCDESKLLLHAAWRED